MPKNKIRKAKIEKARTTRVHNIVQEHGNTFRVETEIKGTYLLVAKDGWRGWISPSEADIVEN